MLQIEDLIVSDELFTEYFSCDYDKCKGACCVVGESGAPVEEEEAEELEHAWEACRPIMTTSGVETVRRTGFFEIDGDGDMVTPLMPMSAEARRSAGLEILQECHDNPCAYAFFEGGNCLCAVERAHIKGKCTFCKPISCRLYPIRVVNFSDGSKGLNLHRWELCREAFAKGRREGVKVYQFLKGPIEAAFGEEFYSALCEADRRFFARS